MSKHEITVDRYAVEKIALYEHEAANYEARLSAALVERWGIVAAEQDGEDSTGRAKLRRMTPVEVVTAACDTAGLLVAEFRKRGWMIQLPTLEEARAMREEGKRPGLAGMAGAMGAMTEALRIAEKLKGGEG